MINAKGWQDSPPPANARAFRGSRPGSPYVTVAEEGKRRMQVTTCPVHYRDGSTQLTGFLARPDSTDRARRIVLVHGGAGLDDHAKEQAVRYARLGYPVLACDMYGDEVTGGREGVKQTIMRLRDDRAAIRARVDAAVEALGAEIDGDFRYAVIGYCFGGLVALEYARSGAPASGVVSIHGSLATSQPAAPGVVAASVLACHGALDPHVPISHVTGFVTEMTEAAADWQLNVYGGAMHGFTHRTATVASNGVAYDHAADQRSFTDSQRFLREVFEAPHDPCPV